MKHWLRLEINGKTVYEPQPKQRIFHDTIINRVENGIRYILYGGAAKGGKSHALRFEAHRLALEHPGIRILLIRSSFPELNRTHLTKVQLDLPMGVLSYNDQKHVAKYRTGSVLEFGYGNNISDFQQYLSAEYDVIMVDELTTISFELIVLLWSRLAASIPNFVPFFAGASNPGSVSHVSVKKTFITHNISSDIIDNYDKSKFFFIPAKVYDNQILIARDPEIVNRLENLPYKEQQKYLWGNWDIFEGQFFDEWNPEVHVLPKEVWGKLDISTWKQGAGMDYGNTTSTIWAARDHFDNIHLYDEFHTEKKVRQVKIDGLKEFMREREYKHVLIADTNMWNPDGFDLAITNTAAMDYIKNGIQLIKVSKSSPDQRKYRINCNDTFRNLLHWEGEGGIAIKKPKFYVWDRCVNFIETFPSLITDEKDVEDIADNQNDHDYDAAKHIVMSLVPPPKLKDDEPVARKYIIDKRKPKTVKFA